MRLERSAGTSSTTRQPDLGHIESGQAKARSCLRFATRGGGLGVGVLDLGQGSFVARQKDGSHGGGLSGCLVGGWAGCRSSINSWPRRRVVGGREEGYYGLFSNGARADGCSLV